LGDTDSTGHAGDLEDKDYGGDDFTGNDGEEDEVTEVKGNSNNNEGKSKSSADKNEGTGKKQVSAHGGKGISVSTVLADTIIRMTSKYEEYRVEVNTYSINNLYGKKALGNRKSKDQRENSYIDQLRSTVNRNVMQGRGTSPRELRSKTIGDPAQKAATSRKVALATGVLSATFGKSKNPRLKIASKVLGIVSTFSTYNAYLLDMDVAREHGKKINKGEVFTNGLLDATKALPNNPMAEFFSDMALLEAAKFIDDPDHYEFKLW
jgi:hypothetical protein